MGGLSIRNSNNPFVVDSLLMRVDYAGGINPVYIGRAKPGSAETENKWQIRKLTHDANNNVLTVDFAGGTSDFIHRWDKRDTDYDYS